MYEIFKKGLSVLKVGFHFLLNCMLILKPPNGVKTETSVESSYSDRRRSGGKRADERIELALPITLLDYKGKTENISSNGIYFIVPEDENVDKFPLGTEARIDLVATTKGVVVRNDKRNGGHASSLGVALKFDEKLEFALPSFS